MTFVVAKHPRDKRRCAFTPLFLRRGIFALRRRPHAGPGMHVTFFVSLWKREKCANHVPRGSKERKVVKRPKGKMGVGSEGEF